MPLHIVIVGNGLAGALLAVLLAKQGHRVSVYERRGDPRAKGYQGGRSINLALSARGLAGLEAAGLAETVRARDIIPMPGRMLHPVAGSLAFQPYSKNPADAINSVSRGGLNLTLIEAAAATPGVSLYFDHPCVDVDLTATTATFQKADGAKVTVTGDLIVGADGAFSSVRGVMQKTDRFEYSQTYLGHGYKELHIPPKQGAAGPEYAMDPGALHIWPRGSSMMIALPNRDKSFTCTLFWPFDGPHSFASLKTPADVGAFFREQYPDAVPLMPTLEHDFFANPTSSLLTVRCWPWVRHGTVLVGDAAHAIVPFYGQGMNAAFEDCVALASVLKGVSTDGLGAALDAYQASRKPHADAIAEMALDNFVEMRDKVGRPEFLYRKKVEQTLHAEFPERVEPQYNLVSFSTVPYAEARRRGRMLDAVVDAVVERLPIGSREAMGDAAWAKRIHELGGPLLHAQVDPVAASRALIDISPTISPTMNVWPGDTPYSREVLLDTENGNNITLSAIRSTVHLGSHADASNHYGKAEEGAVGISNMPLHHYIGACQVVRTKGDCRGRRIQPADIDGLEAVRSPRVLIRTGTFPDYANWNSDFAALSVELVEFLASRGVVTVGVDTPSVDPQDSKDLPAHRAILKHRIAILEGLNLRDVAPGTYELIAPPLKIEAGDASPVRAVLRTETRP